MLSMSTTQILLLFVFFICCLLFLFSSEKRPLLNLGNRIGYIDNKALRQPLVLITISLILIAVFRYPGMADYRGYKLDFESYHDFDTSEPFYDLIIFIAQITPWPWMIGSLIIATIGISLKITYIEKYSPVVWGSVLVYLSYIYVVQDLIAIRSACAAAMLFPILENSVKRNYKKALMFNLGAICFHVSSIIFIPLIFLNKEKGYRFLYVIGIFLSYYLANQGILFGKLIALLEIGNIGNKYMEYAYGEETNIFNIVLIVRVIICIIAWMFYKKMYNMYPQMLLYLKIYTIGIILFVLFSDIVSAAIRLQELLLIVEIILIPCLFISVFGENKVLSKISIITYAVMAFFLLTFNNYALWRP